MAGDLTNDLRGDLTALEEAIARLLEGLEVDLVDLELRQGSLVVSVTRPNGLDLDSLTSAARAVSDFLDQNEQLTPDGSFELEVSSPGLERRLRKPEHFRQALGSLIAVRTVAGTAGERRIEGTLVGLDDGGITVAIGEGGDVCQLGYDAIDRAHTVFDWKAALASDKRERADVSDKTSSSVNGPRAKKSQHQPQASTRARERE